MRRKNLSVLALAMVSFLPAVAQQTITITGKVKFTDENFKIQVYQREGTSKKVLAEVPVAADKTYKIDVPVAEPGVAIVDCGHWQSVNVWLEDENMDINFRGLDTARIKIKNPPYVYINGGKKAEVMNMINFEAYRNYQHMIAVSQATYRAKIEDQKKSQELSMALYDAGSDNYRAHMRYITEHFADRSSVLAAISSLNAEKDKELIDEALATLSATSASNKQLVDNYLKKEAARKEAAERMKEGNPAPDFEFLTVKGKKTSLKKYKGKVLLLDFWASWCGPCRQEIPNMKKYYEEYKDKGVEFLSVSIDAKKDAWTKAMKEENMAWQQGWVSDAGKSVMNTYQFGGIPFIILIDKEGNIYKKLLRGEAIKQAIDEVLAGKKAGAKKTISMSMGAAMM